MSAKKILLTNILISLRTYNSSVSAVLMEVIARIKCHIHMLHLKGYLKQQRKENNF